MVLRRRVDKGGRSTVPPLHPDHHLPAPRPHRKTTQHQHKPTSPVDMSLRSTLRPLLSALETPFLRHTPVGMPPAAATALLQRPSTAALPTWTQPAALFDELFNHLGQAAFPAVSVEDKGNGYESASGGFALSGPPRVRRRRRAVTDLPSHLPLARLPMRSPNLSSLPSPLARHRRPSPGRPRRLHQGRRQGPPGRRQPPPDPRGRDQDGRGRRRAPRRPGRRTHRRRRRCR